MKRTLFLAAAIFAGVVSAGAECPDADKAALQAFDTAWGVAGETGNRAAMNDIYADDFVALPAMTGKAAAIEGAMRAFERNKANPAGAEKVTHDGYMITCTPNSATITHRNIVWTPRGEGGKPESFWTRSIHVLEKRGGKWQVVTNAGHDMDDYMILGYLEQDWNNAVLKRDKAWFEKNFASDYSSISSSSAALSNKADDIADALKGGSGETWNRLSDLDIRIDGNTAIVTGVNHVKGKDDKGVAFDRKVRFTDTWIKRDGRWQAWATQGTRMP